MGFVIANKKLIISAAFIVLLALALVFGSYWLMNLGYQSRVETLKNRVEYVGAQTVDLGKGVAITNIDVHAPQWLDSLQCIDTGPCPRVGREYVALSQETNQTEFVKTILRSSGYSDGDIRDLGDNTVSGTLFSEVLAVKDGITLKVEARSPLRTDVKTPYSAPEGKKWIDLYVSANY